MNFKVFAPSTVPASSRNSSRIPYLQLNCKTGLIRINGEAVAKMNIKENSLVQFHQDENDSAVWYLSIVKADGFSLRSNKSHGVYLNTAFVARKIFESVECDKESGRLLVGEEIKHGKQVYYTLITSSLNAATV